MTIKTNTAKERNALLGMLIALGYVWHKGLEDETTKIEDIKYTFEQGYSTINVSGESMRISANCSGYGTDYTFPQDTKAILDELSINAIVVENVGDYTAKVSPKGIEVGCQTISFEKFQEIADAVAKVNKI